MHWIVRIRDDFLFSDYNSAVQVFRNNTHVVQRKTWSAKECIQYRWKSNIARIRSSPMRSYSRFSWYFKDTFVGIRQFWLWSQRIQRKLFSQGKLLITFKQKAFLIFSLQLQVLLNNVSVDELSMIVHASKADQRARSLVAKLKDIIPRQMIQINIQVAVNNKILARETLKAFRKDVTAKLVSTIIQQWMLYLVHYNS